MRPHLTNTSGALQQHFATPVLYRELHDVSFKPPPPAHRPQPRRVNPSGLNSNQLPAHPTTRTHHITMADVDMADAPPAKTKTGKASAGGEGDKKRFEVKKVATTRQQATCGK